MYTLDTQEDDDAAIAGSTEQTTPLTKHLPPTPSYLWAAMPGALI